MIDELLIFTWLVPQQVTGAKHFYYGMIITHHLISISGECLRYSRCACKTIEDCFGFYLPRQLENLWMSLSFEPAYLTPSVGGASQGNRQTRLIERSYS